MTEDVTRYVLGDWGTSRLRLYLVEDDAVVTSREGPGINALVATPAGRRAGILAELVAPWMNRKPFRVLLSGMAGSRNGLFEVPYATLPADRTAWSISARSMRTDSLHVTIAAGLRSTEGGTADVMRGEENQVFGALQLDAELGRGSQVAVLPGTHSKWVETADGSIVRFRSAMSGELYALLHDHSTLLKTAGATAQPAADVTGDRDEGFSAGVVRSGRSQGSLLSALFEARAAQLLDDRSKAWAAGFLSGLLIGHEIASGLESFRGNAAIRLIGEPALVSLYRSVFSKRGIETRVLDGADCAIAGLRSLHQHLPEN